MLSFILKTKNVTLCFFAIVISFSCKKNQMINNVSTIQTKNISQKNIKQIVFSGQPDLAGIISQHSADNKIKRTLIPLNSKNRNLHKYMLIEQGLVKNTQSQTFVISKKSLTSENNLFDISFTAEGITAYETDNKKGTSYKLLLKHDNKELDVNSGINQSSSLNENITPNYALPSGQAGYCVDHWWIIYNEETGEILSIDYLGSDCYGCALTGDCSELIGGGGGGGTPPDSASILGAASSEYEEAHKGTFGYLNTITLFFVYNAVAKTREVEWYLATSPYFEVKCKSLTTAKNNKPTMKIHVDNLYSTTTTFVRTGSSILWNISWVPDNLTPGLISANDTFFPKGDIDMTGNVHYTARSSWFEFLNVQPDVAVSSSLRINYDLEFLPD